MARHVARRRPAGSTSSAEICRPSSRSASRAAWEPPRSGSTLGVPSRRSAALPSSVPFAKARVNASGGSVSVRPPTLSTSRTARSEPATTVQVTASASLSRDSSSPIRRPKAKSSGRGSARLAPRAAVCSMKSRRLITRMGLREGACRMASVGALRQRQQAGRVGSTSARQRVIPPDRFVTSWNPASAR